MEWKENRNNFCTAHEHTMTAAQVFDTTNTHAYAAHSHTHTHVHAHKHRCTVLYVAKHIY